MSELLEKVKVVVTVPTDNTNDLRIAMSEAGAGAIGNYTCCSTVTKSIGTFIPNENANPYIGKNDILEFVEEDKLEMVCSKNKVAKVVKAIRSIHPYEEPAIDIIPLLNEKQFKL